MANEVKRTEVTLTVKLTILSNEDNATEVLENMDYSFESCNEGASIVYTEIKEWDL